MVGVGEWFIQNGWGRGMLSGRECLGEAKSWWMGMV